MKVRSNFALKSTCPSIETVGDKRITTSNTKQQAIWQRTNEIRTVLHSLGEVSIQLWYSPQRNDTLLSLLDKSEIYSVVNV